MRPVFLTAFLLFSYVLCAQSTCEVWQWTGTDSANKILASSQQLDAHGNVIHDKQSGYLYEPDIYGYGGVDGWSIYIYSDTLLVTHYYADAGGDSTRTDFQYDENGRRTREVHWRRKFVNTAPVQSGMYTITTVSVDSADNKWVKASETNYTYDAEGRIMKQETTWPGSKLKNCYTWMYDAQGRVAMHDYINLDRHHYTEKYVYMPRQVFVSRTYYDEKGKAVKHPDENSPPYMQRQVFVTVRDEQGRVIEKRVEGSKGKVLQKELITYNAQGKVAREVWYDGEGQVQMVHEYVYK